MRTLEQELRSFVVDNFLYGKDVGFSDNTSFLEMGIINSSGLLELIVFLEKQYYIAVEDAELIPANLDSIVQLAEFVRRKLPEAASAGSPSIPTDKQRESVPTIC